MTLPRTPAIDRSTAVYQAAAVSILAPVEICAWCPDFNPAAVSNRTATHGICPVCTAKFEGRG